MAGEAPDISPLVAAAQRAVGDAFNLMRIAIRNFEDAVEDYEAISAAVEAWQRDMDTPEAGPCPCYLCAENCGFCDKVVPADACSSCGQIDITAQRDGT